ncbi:MAG: hypothetical protein GYB64_00315 [Chloroflexi bacterium]|nr:hypothetical protein [Chloroflexota bacterium]
MPLPTRHLDDLPVLITTAIPPIEEPYQLVRDLRDYVDTYLAEHHDPVVYRIVDVSQVDLTLFEGMNGLAEDAANATDRERFMFVGQSEMVRILADAAAQEQYGAHGARAYSTLDDAMADIRAELRR